MKNNDTPTEGQSSEQLEAESALRGAACSASSLFTLAEMWLEGAKVCLMTKVPGWHIEKAIYEACARDLLDVLAGKLDCIEEINPDQNVKHIRDDG